MMRLLTIAGRLRDNAARLWTSHFDLPNLISLDYTLLSFIPLLNSFSDK
jgi:hypothetical protein